MATINTYLNFNGNTEDAFNFYKAAFGGDFAVIMRFGDTPGCEEMPETDKNKIMHIALPIGGNMLMGTDVQKRWNKSKTEPVCPFQSIPTLNSRRETCLQNFLKEAKSKCR